MKIAWGVAGDVWVGLAAGARPSVGPSERLSRDRHAAASAELAAAAAGGFGASRYEVSRSHTEGVGAAIVAPAGARVGIDLLALDRVTARHAAAILTDAEWAVLGRAGSMRAGLAWALKEAAAKATGEPLRTFPGGLRIDAESSGLLVGTVGEPTVKFAAGWVRFGPLLCAWVREEGRGRAPAHT